LLLGAIADFEIKINSSPRSYYISGMLRIKLPKFEDNNLLWSYQIYGIDKAGNKLLLAQEADPRLNTEALFDQQPVASKEFSIWDAAEKEGGHAKHGSEHATPKSEHEEAKAAKHGGNETKGEHEGGKAEHAEGGHEAGPPTMGIARKVYASRSVFTGLSGIIKLFDDADAEMPIAIESF
jgi:hypothetical protein